MSELPKVEGWSVDERLEEFRRVTTDKDGNPRLETEPFYSRQGERLLKKYYALPEVRARTRMEE